jgi:hypothetical protein
MSDKSTVLRTFNTHFFEFIDDILNIFPNNADLMSARKSFETIKKANPTAILKAWFSFVYSPYIEQIESGNIEFFFEKNYKDDLTNLANGGEVMKIIDSFRNPVKNMSDTNKAHTMKYIQNLSKLSILYSGAAR